MVSTTFGFGRLANSSGVANGSAGSGSAFFAQLFLDRALLFGDLLLADLKLSFQIRLAHPAAQQPEPQRDKSPPGREDTLPNEMDRPQPGHQNQARQVNAGEDDDRPLAHRITKDVPAKEIADPAARSLDVENPAPIVQKPRLQMEQAGAGGDEKDDPAKAAANPQLAVKKLRAAEAEQRRREKIGSRADQEIANAGDDRAEWAEEILRRPIRRRSGIKEREPGRDVLGNVGDEGKKEQCPGSEKNQGVDFVPCILLSAFRHRGS